MSNSEFLKNHLMISLDWLEFTIKTTKNPFKASILFGYVESDFTLLEKGGLGYKSMLKHNAHDICIFYNGNDDMGVHIRVKGSAVSSFLTDFKDSLKEETVFGVAYDIPFEYSVSNIIPYLLKTILDNGSLSRIDLAIDDLIGDYFSMNELQELLENKLCVSKFKGWRNVCEKSIFGETLGHTIYLGSRTSELLIRIYDKFLEQRNKNKSIDSFSNWIRWELQLKGCRANEAAKALISKQNVGVIAIGILNHYVRFIESDNNNRSRCSINQKWLKFIANIEKLKLSTPKRETTIEEKIYWLNRQSMPNLAGVIYAKGGDLGFITDSLEFNFSRLNKESRKTFERAREKFENTEE